MFEFEPIIKHAERVEYLEEISNELSIEVSSYLPAVRALIIPSIMAFALVISSK